MKSHYKYSSLQRGIRDNVAGLKTVLRLSRANYRDIYVSLSTVYDTQPSCWPTYDKIVRTSGTDPPTDHHEHAFNESNVSFQLIGQQSLLNYLLIVWTVNYQLLLILSFKTVRETRRREEECSNGGDLVLVAESVFIFMSHLNVSSLLLFSRVTRYERSISFILCLIHDYGYSYKLVCHARFALLLTL